MDKSANRNQNSGRGQKLHKGAAQTPASTGMVGEMVDKVLDTNLDAKEFIGDLGKSLPKIAKFSRDNWKQIAFIGGAVAVVPLGADTYLGADKISSTGDTQHEFNKRRTF